jgi:hypothetical protein
LYDDDVNHQDDDSHHHHTKRERNNSSPFKAKLVLELGDNVALFAVALLVLRPSIVG